MTPLDKAREAREALQWAVNNMRKMHECEADEREVAACIAQCDEALAALDAAPSVRVPDELPVPTPFAGTMGAVHERGHAVGWNACRAEVLRLNGVKE